jgi:hypothetical protein
LLFNAVMHTHRCIYTTEPVDREPREADGVQTGEFKHHCSISRTFGDQRNSIANDNTRLCAQKGAVDLKGIFLSCRHGQLSLRPLRYSNLGLNPLERGFSGFSARYFVHHAVKAGRDGLYIMSCVYLRSA